MNKDDIAIFEFLKNSIIQSAHNNEIFYEDYQEFEL